MLNVAEGNGRNYSIPSRGDVVKLEHPRDSFKVELPDGRVLIITGTGQVFSESTGDESV